MSITDIEYVAPGQLRKWFTTGSPTGSGKFAVVDVRDSDYIGVGPPLLKLAANGSRDN